MLGETVGTLDFSRSRTQMILIESIRIIVLSVILIITLVSQAIQVQFINLETVLPLYIILFLGFSLNFSYLFFFERFLRLWFVPGILFSLEVLLITSLIFFSGVNQSIFLFMYLVNIILAGLVYQKRGAFAIAAQSSVFFSLLMAVGPDISGLSLFFVLALNNVAFFAVAALAGYLSEQINFMGVQLSARRRDIKVLQRLNNLIVENIPSGLLTVVAGGEILQCNRVAYTILGEQEELIGKSIFDIFPELREQFDKFRLRDANEKTTKFDLEYNGTSERQILNFTLSSLEDPERINNGYVIIIEDLTNIRKLEFAVRQSEKMAAIGQLAAGIAHEIRNPLASISGSIQLMKMSATTDDDRKLMSIVLKETDRLNGLITEFLEYSRPDVPVKDPLDLNKLTIDVLEFVKMNRDLRPGIRQKVDLQSRSLITGQSDKMKQAILNIVINSYQAMMESEEPTLEVSTKDVGEKVVLVIKDNGCGMREETKRRMFEPFHTTKHKGTGLGLATTHKILQNHSAQIFVESQLGLGTEFIIEIPAR